MPSEDVCPHTGKVRHPSEKVARTSLNRVRRGMDGAGKDRKERGKLDVYRCPACHGFHIGNNAPNVIRVERARRLDRSRARELDEGEAA